MEALIIIIVLAVLSNVLGSSKKKQAQQQTANRRAQTLEDLDSSPEEYRYDEADEELLEEYEEPVPEPPQKRPVQMNMEDLRRYFGEQVRPAPQTSRPQGGFAGDLCEANPEVTPNADMQEDCMIEQELKRQGRNNSSQPVHATVHPVTATVHPTETIIQPTLKTRGGNDQGVDIEGFGKKRGLSPIQQAVIWNDVLGAPMAKRWQSRRRD